MTHLDLRNTKRYRVEAPASFWSSSPDKSIHTGQGTTHDISTAQFYPEKIDAPDNFSRCPTEKPPASLVNADGLRLLTKREEDVVQLLQEGFTNREIALDLHLSEHTVRNNLFRIFDKLGVSTRVELALYAINNSTGKPPVAENDHHSEPHREENRAS